jgi:hypothetical protein
MNYTDAISADTPGWKSEAIKLMEKKEQPHFVVTGYEPEMRQECIALAQEHDYRVVEVKAGQVGFKPRDFGKPRLE